MLVNWKSVCINQKKKSCLDKLTLSHKQEKPRDIVLTLYYKLRE